jgi:hypothetical protein
MVNVIIVVRQLVDYQKPDDTKEEEEEKFG